MALLAGEPGGDERREHLGRDQRADHAPAQAEHVAVVVLDGLVGRVGVVRRRRRGCPGTCRPRPRRRRPSRRRSPRARRRRDSDGLGGARARRRGSRPGRSSSCRGRSVSWPSACSVSSTNCFSGNARMVERAGDLHEPLSFGRAPIPARPSAPRRARRRAGRGARGGSSSWCPRPGSTCRNATRVGRLEQQVAGGGDAAADHDLERVVEVDRVGDPDAEPLAEDPQAAPRRLVALLRAVDAVVAGDLAVGAPAAGRGTSPGRAAAASSASRSSALPEASASSEPGCGKSESGRLGARRRGRGR